MPCSIADTDTFFYRKYFSFFLSFFLSLFFFAVPTCLSNFFCPFIQQVTLIFVVSVCPQTPNSVIGYEALRFNTTKVIGLAMKKQNLYASMYKEVEKKSNKFIYQVEKGNLTLLSAK